MIVQILEYMDLVDCRLTMCFSQELKLAEIWLWSSDIYDHNSISAVTLYGS